MVVFTGCSEGPLMICSKRKAQCNSTEGVSIVNCMGCHEIRHMLHDLGRQSRFVIFCQWLMEESI